MSTFDLPAPTLGQVWAVTITSTDLDRSLAYWQQLGFQLVMQSDFPFPWIQISDGALLLMIRKDDAVYQALTYYVKNIEEVVAGLEAAGIKFAQRPAPTDFVKKYLLRSPDGTNISLINIMDGFQQPPGATMLTLPQQHWMDPSKYVNNKCGLFGEFAEPVANLETSMAFWQQLGFKVLSKYASPQPWAILSDGLTVVGLHQTTEFAAATITFFAKDMKDKIDALKREGLQNFVEHSPGNIILTTPEQQKINLFSF